MSALTIGDLSQSYFLRQRQTALKTQMLRLTTELASGQRADSRQPNTGSHSYVADIEIKMTRLSAFTASANEAAQFSSTLQLTLGALSDRGQQLSDSLLAAGTSVAGLSITEAPAEARGVLSAMVAAINTDTAGRYTLSGTATDQPPLASAESLLSALRTAMTGATTPAAMQSAAQLWFDDPGGFEATIYQGNAAPLPPFALAPTENADLPLTALDPAIKDLLMQTALAALADDPAFGLSVTAQSELFSSTGEALLGARDQMTALQARTGFAEARIERAVARNASEMAALEIARSDLLAVDPFEAATRLEEVQFQLQSLYSVTVRSAQLSLANFL